MHDWSWARINADINTKTINTTTGISLPKVNIYFEDKEAEDFFTTLMNRQPIKKFISTMSGVTLGCDNYLQLIKKKIPEFTEKSIICLDADQASKTNEKKLKNIVLLPGMLPPDQLIFEHMYNLSADNEFWDNSLQFTRAVFTKIASEVLREFSISGNSVNVKDRVATYSGTIKPREIFKRFYQNDEFQQLVSSGEKPYNPWRHWIASNPIPTNDFLKKFKTAILGVMSSGYAVDTSKLASLDVKFKKT